MTETCLERWKRRKPHFTCPKCDATSWSLNDVAHQYCGRCHVFFGHDFVRNRPPSYGAFAERPPRANPHERAREDDTTSAFPTFSTPSYDPPAADPSPSSIDPGGGSSGGGGASGDW